MDWSILDTDVDVINEDPWWLNYIIDCKYRSNSEGKLCELMKEAVESTAKGKIPLIRFATDKYWYQVLRLSDFDEKDNIPYGPAGHISFVDDIGSRYHVHTEVARAGTTYLDEWFDKLMDTYRPLKEKETGVDKELLFPAVTIRKKGVRQTVIVFRCCER